MYFILDVENNTRIIYMHTNGKTMSKTDRFLLLMWHFRRIQKKKIYVTQKMKEHKKEIWQLLSQEGAVFYVSGKAGNMPRDVKETLVQIVLEEGGLTPQESEKYVALLDRQNRYLSETWF